MHLSESSDLGKTWSDPQPIPGLGRKKFPNGIQEGVCDTVPQDHPQTDSVIFMGWNVYYRDDKLTKPNEERWPVYVVRRADGSWSEPHKLDWDNPAAARIKGSNCSQRITLPDGDILVPLTYGSYGREDRLVSTVLCSFDGEKLQVKKSGNALELAVKRGLLEPSITFFQDRYYMTIRAEDGHGYLSVSDDGLNWEPKHHGRGTAAARSRCRPRNSTGCNTATVSTSSTPARRKTTQTSCAGVRPSSPHGSTTRKRSCCPIPSRLSCR